MKFLRRASLLRLCVAIGMMIGIAGCQPKITPAQVYYTLTFNVKDNTGGTLIATANSKALTNNEKVKAGTKVRFTATPKTADGYTVGAWTGIDAAVGTGAVELIITQDVAVTVAFVKNPPPPVQECTVKFSIAEHAEGGTFTATAGSKTLTNNEKVKAGTKVRFTATPKTADSYAIGAWTGIDAAAGTGVVELIITQDVNVTVAFVKIPRYGTITFGASEGGSISAKVEADNLQSGGTAPYGSTVTFTAIPEDGYVFDRWEGLTDAPSEGTATYTVTGDRYVKAYFKSAALPYLSVASVVAGEGTVSFLGDDSRKTELKGKVIIPEWINGIHITRIELTHCTEITEIVLPESIDYINGFYGCTKLQTIKIPKNKKLTVINQSCFSGCAKLEKIYLPENITKIFEGAFSGCTSLELYLPKSIQIIGNYAFGSVYSGHTNDSRIKKVYIPSSISEIEKDRIKELIRRSNQNHGIGIQPEQIGEYDDTQPIP